MKTSTLLGGAATVAFIFTTGAAMADGWDWTPDREHGFYERYNRDPVRSPPPEGFNVTVGGVVPDGVEIYDPPADYDYAPARNYRYTSANKHVYVVDPKTRKVVRIIEK